MTLNSATPGCEEFSIGRLSSRLWRSTSFWWFSHSWTRSLTWLRMSLLQSCARRRWSNSFVLAEVQKDTDWQVEWMIGITQSINKWINQFFLLIGGLTEQMWLSKTIAFYWLMDWLTDCLTDWLRIDWLTDWLRSQLVDRLMDCSWDLQTVYLSRFSMRSGYLVSRCITVGMRSFNSRRRHNGWLAASYTVYNISNITSIYLHTHTHIYI